MYTEKIPSIMYLSSTNYFLPHQSFHVDQDVLMYFFLSKSRRGSKGALGAQSPLTLGFEAPKLTIFGPYLIFP